VYVGVDLEREDLAGAVRAAGLAPHAAAIVLWLGVLPYLSLDAVTATLRALAGLGRVEVVLDYGEPLADRTGPARDAFEAAAARVAQAGEPWITFLTPVDLRRLLRDTGFALVEDVDVVAYVAAALGRPRPDRRSPAHLVHARSADGP
jgi:O-methyltransferase involved in polyketide biosynthesis